MSVIAAATVEAAREHLDEYGLCRDGTWGELDGPCCTIGAIALAWLGDDPGVYGDLDGPADYLSENVAEAWRRWMAEEGCPVDALPKPLAERLIEWNDSDASIDAVRRFYDWWAADLTAAGMGAS